MTELTIGQRIAHCRKTLGLSQESLGEKVGVSRQAISKWEADGAIPEIDKLIALSRLFDVSVGWLLGVEEDTKDTPEQPSDISEELLRKIEQIVLRYRPGKEKMSTRKKVILGIGICLALWLLTVFCSIWRAERNTLAYTYGQIQNINEQNANIQKQLDELSQRLDELSGTVEDAESPLTSYSFHVAPKSSNGITALITFTAIPKAMDDTLDASLTVRLNGSPLLTRACSWDGSAWTTEVELGIQDGYEFIFTLHQPGAGKTQYSLTDEIAQNLQTYLAITCEVTQGTGDFQGSPENMTLTLIDYLPYIRRSEALADNTRFFWNTAEYILYINRNGVQEEIGRYDLLGTDDEIRKAWDISFIATPTFSLPPMEEGDGLILWFHAAMENDLSEAVLVNSWTYVNNTFIASNPVSMVIPDEFK